ncbi:MAG: VOC family protein [Victivallaceae bacterium]|nr:VOC family protein [Victivallaceae bacterium]
MKFRFVHYNFNVLNLDRSIEFYREALGLEECRRIVPEDGSFIIVYLCDGISDFQLELTWMRDRTEPYNLGDNEMHLAFRVDDYAAAHEKHEKMNCICYENPGMGIYFINDPDGYWLEVIPTRR